MKKEHLYYVVIPLGLLAPLVYFGGSVFSSAGKLEPPGVLEEKVVHGTSEGERLAAAKGLIKHGAAARKEVRRALAASRQADVEVRDCLLQAAMQIQDWRSMPEIFAAMEDADATIRARGGAAAVKIMGRDFASCGFCADDPPQKREKIVAKLRHDFETLQRRYVKFYRDQEE